MWNYKIVSVVPIVFGAFGAVPKNLMMWVTKIIIIIITFYLYRANSTIQFSNAPYN